MSDYQPLQSEDEQSDIIPAGSFHKSSLFSIPSNAYSTLMKTPEKKKNENEKALFTPTPSGNILRSGASAPRSARESFELMKENTRIAAANVATGSPTVQLQHPQPVRRATVVERSHTLERNQHAGTGLPTVQKHQQVMGYPPVIERGRTLERKQYQQHAHAADATTGSLTVQHQQQHQVMGYPPGFQRARTLERFHHANNTNTGAANAGVKHSFRMTSQDADDHLEDADHPLSDSLREWRERLDREYGEGVQHANVPKADNQVAERSHSFCMTSDDTGDQEEAYDELPESLREWRKRLDREGRL
ncbi:hypothetical protein F5Y16DRAFT_398415 [Xylariaceae sp. FL0255]|nr:hypothetical protein F5Y16DRAFT_398415 [Xylariaceae sp. FL0255]